MSVLSSLKISKTITSQQVLIDMITEHAELEGPFSPEPEIIEKFTMCVKAAIPHFSPFVPSNLFVQYICTQIIPCLNEIDASETGDITEIEVELLQQLAELSAFIQPTNTNLPINLDECQELVFSKLFDYMPSPSLTIETEEKSEEPCLQLFPLESLMYTLYTLSVHNPEFNSKIEEDKMKDYKIRLQYLARLIQSHIKKALDAISSDKKPTGESETRDNAMILRTATNINTLVKELFHPKPASKSSISLSWKPIKTKAAAIKRSNSNLDANNGQTVSVTKTEETTTNPTNPKRKPITAPEDSSPKKQQRQLYAPPSGKFSYNFRGGYQNNRGRGRGMGGGGFRGGNRGRNNNRYSKRYSY